MISEEREADERGRGAFFWALLLSIAIHALLVPLASWSWLANLPLVPAKPPTESIVASTAVRIEKRAVPQPRTHALPPRAPVPPAVARRVRRAQPVTRAAPPAESARHELAREMPTAQPTPERRIERRSEPSVPLEQQIARQQREFSEEIARLHARDNPLSLAPHPRQPPAAFRRTYFDVPGHRRVDAVQIQLIPLRHWYSTTTI
jgi:hypothetical protein